MTREFSRSRPARSRPYAGRERGRDRPAPELPQGYLKGGYFDEQGELREEFVTKWAEEIGESLARGRIGKAQLRRFFSHVRDAERVNRTAGWPPANLQVKKLLPLVAYASGRERARPPKIFQDFIEQNVNSVKQEKDFLKGFLPHFEAVVGYSWSKLRG